MVERDAGLCSGFADDLYVNAGATVVDDKTDVFNKSDVILFVRAVGTDAKLQEIYCGRTWPRGSRTFRYRFDSDSLSLEQFVKRSGKRSTRCKWGTQYPILSLPEIAL